MFQIYVLFLILSGVAMLIMAGIKNGQPPVRRAWNAIFGAAFTGYGLYLLLFFRGGHYVLFFYAFILPVIMIARFFRDGSVSRQRTASFPAAPTGYGAPAGYGQAAGSAEPPAGGQPGYGQPPGNTQPSVYGALFGDKAQGPGE